MTHLSKLPDVGTTIFTVMSQLATEHGAINLGQGFPDFDPDKRLVDAVTKAMLDGHNQYPPMPGIPALRQGISEKIKNLYGFAYDPINEITVTSGASEALMASILAFVHPGDEVIVIEPFYDLYIPAITLAGGIPVVVSMQVSDSDTSRYSIDWDRVRSVVTHKTKLLILNFPHNPTGINLREADLDALEKIVSDTNILILSDEVYEHIIFNGQRHQSLCRRPVLADKSIVVSSFGKTYHVTGWKIGYCCAPKPLMNEIRKVHQFMVFTVSSPMQVALADYMQDVRPYLDLATFYEEKHNKLLEGLTQTKLVPMPSEGTFFLLADYSNVSDMPELEFARWLTIEKGVAVIPLSAFYEKPDAPTSNHRLIRFCFAKHDHTLDAAIEKLKGL